MTHSEDPHSDPDTTTPSGVRIGPATNADLDHLADAWVDLARGQHRLGSHVLPQANREAILDVLSAHQFNDGLLVARVDDDLVGFVTFSLERGMFTLDVTRGLLSNLYVDPTYRDRGIGTALLEAAEAALADAGAEVVSLEAMARNEAARRFYRRNGYETSRVTMERSLELERSSENDTHSKEDR